MTEQELFEYIDRYLDGDLSETEKVSFDQKLSLDESFRKEFEKHKMANLLIETNYANKLSSIIVKKQAAAKVAKRNQAVKWSSVVILGLTAAAGAYFLSSTKSNEATAHQEVRVAQIAEADREEVYLKVPKGPESSVVKEPIEIDQKAEKPKVIISKEPLGEAKPKPVPQISQTPAPIILTEASSDTVEEQLVPEPNKDEEALEMSLPEADKTTELLDVNINVVSADCEPFIPNIETVNCDLGASNGQLNFNHAGVAFKVGEYGTFDELSELTGLEKGKYSISAKTQNGCQYDLGVFEIQENHCSNTKNYLFSPGLEANLILPLVEQEESNITIFNSSGTLVLEERLFNADQFEWSGRLSNGSMAAIDSYIVLVNKNQIKSCKYDVVVAK